MIANIISGSGFRGAMNYVLDKSKAVVLGGSFMAMAHQEAFDVERMKAGVMREVGALRETLPNLGKSVRHVSLAIHPNESLASVQWMDIAQRYMDEMGFSHAGWLAVQHFDEPHSHIHIVALRVDTEKRAAVSDSMEKTRSAKIVQGIERDYGLMQATKTPKEARQMASRPHTRKESVVFAREQDGAHPLDHGLGDKAGGEQITPRQFFKEVITRAVTVGTPTFPEFMERLERANIRVVPNVATTGRISGLSYLNLVNGDQIKSSKLGKAFGFKGLLERGVTYERERDLEGIRSHGSKQPAESNGITGEDGREDQEARRRVAAERGGQSGASGVGLTSGAGSHRSVDAVVSGPRRDSGEPDEQRQGVVQRSGRSDAQAVQQVTADAVEVIGAVRQPGGASEEVARREAAIRIVARAVERASAERAVRLKGADRSTHEGAKGGGRSAGRVAGSNADHDAGSRRQVGNPVGAAEAPARQLQPGARGQHRPPQGRADEREIELHRRGPDLRADVDRTDADDGRGGVRRGAELSRAAQIRKAAASKAMLALGSEQYRITLMKDGRGINFTKDPKSGVETLLGHSQVLEKLPILAAKNAQGWNVFITPISDRAHYLVVDDLDGQAGLSELKGLGHKPALVQESSPGNYQAVLKVAKTEVPLERKAANKVVRALNLEIGDPQFTGAVHPFRLAGLANRKPKHEFGKGLYPYVKVISSNGNYDAVATNHVKDNVTALEQELAQRVARTGQASPTSPLGTLPEADEVVLTAERVARKRAVDQVVFKGWELNASRVDFRVAQDLLEQGHQPPAVAAALHAGSPGIEERHPNTADYLDRTVGAAQDRIYAQRDAAAKKAGPDIDI